MSRGPGKVQRILIAEFAEKPGEFPDTAELCRTVYGVKTVEKRHRVAVIRALKRLAETCMPDLARRVLEREKSSDVWFDASVLTALPSAAASAREPRPTRGQ